MNTLSAVELMEENAQWNSNPFIKELMLPNTNDVWFPVQAETNQPLKVTICWSDPPGEMLINDLDMRIIGPSGITNFPWVLNPTNGFRANAATTGDNSYDNVEQVLITSTTSGTYTVLIDHKGTLINDQESADGQELSIILSGVIPENIDPTITFAITSNGFPRVGFPDIIGSVYEIEQAHDLQYSGWSPASNSPLHVLGAQTGWIDPNGSTTNTQFYRIIRER